MPKVSVVMCVYNGMAYLREAVESILQQTFSDFEFIIVNDGSTDRTQEILTGYTDRRIKLINNEKNIGLAKSLNKGLALAKGEYIARMDADDISLPARFSTQVAFLNTHPDIGLLSGNYEVIDEQGVTTDYSKLHGHPDMIKWYELFYNHIAGHCLVMFRSKIVRALGGYSDELLVSQDYDLWSRMAEQTNIVILPEIMIRWRNHRSNISSTRFDEQQRIARMITVRNVGNLIGKSYLKDEEYREMTGFWIKRFSMCRNPLRLWYNLGRVKSAFIKQRKLKSSKQEFRNMLDKIKAKHFFQLSNYWIEQGNCALSIISKILAVFSCPLEGFYRLKSRLIRIKNDNR